MPIAETSITIRYTNGETASLPASTPIYVESWERANSARSDDGSMASIEDLVPAGTLANPDYYVGGVDVEEASWYVEDLGTGNERICVAIAAIEDTEDDLDTVDDAIDAAITVDGNKLIALYREEPQQILDLMGLDLHSVTHTTHTDGCEWRCGVEGKWWPIACHQLTLTDLYAVRWTATDEAGIDDVEIVEIVDHATDAADLLEWCRELAAACGSCDGTVR